MTISMTRVNSRRPGIIVDLLMKEEVTVTTNIDNKIHRKQESIMEWTECLTNLLSSLS